MSMKSGLTGEFSSITRESPSEPTPRMYVFEQGWKINIKRGSAREFCHVMTPGQDFYHRLLDGEIYLTLGDQKLCIACAAYKGLITFGPRQLKNPIDPSLADSSDLPVFDENSGDLV